ncbi:MAG TPA: TIM44-like domain-containing protein [Burkholderiales bacterium]|nr:TIM44-like domain-containing protein [Burkholderiales bacterium]
MNRIRSSFSTSLTLAAFVTALFCALMFASHDADARRLGGGKSFGKQSSTVTQRQAASPSAPNQELARPAQPPTATPAPQPAGNRWLGPLVGIAAGLGIGALLSHFGLGGAFADGLGSIIVIALLVMAGVFIWRLLKRGTAPSQPTMRTMEPAYSSPAPAGSGGDVNVFGGRIPAGASSPHSAVPSSAPHEPWGVPADFDVNGFLRVAKVNFLRLQAAWDAQNLSDIREFTTPEVFAEIRMQIDEDKGAVNSTEVSDLEATLLGIETGPDNYMASVRFSGAMRENSTTAAPFEEVWNLTKPMDGKGGWLLAGIQQMQ